MSTMFEISILTLYGLDKKQAHAHAHAQAHAHAHAQAHAHAHAHAHAVTATANLCFTCSQHVLRSEQIKN